MMVSIRPIKDEESGRVVQCRALLRVVAVVARKRGLCRFDHGRTRIQKIKLLKLQ